MPQIKCEQCGEAFPNKTQRRNHAKSCKVLTKPINDKKLGKKSASDKKIISDKKSVGDNNPSQPAHAQAD